MNIVVNGNSRSLAEQLSIDGLLLQLQLKRELVAVELNRRIVRRGDYSMSLLNEGDTLEIVEFVGGG